MSAEEKHKKFAIEVLEFNPTKFGWGAFKPKKYRLFNDVVYKKCFICGYFKPISDFPKRHTKNKKIRLSHCGDCDNEKSRYHRLKNRLSEKQIRRDSSKDNYYRLVESSRLSNALKYLGLQRTPGTIKIACTHRLLKLLEFRLIDKVEAKRLFSLMESGEPDYYKEFFKHKLSRNQYDSMSIILK